MKGIFERSIRNKEKIIMMYIDHENNVTQRYVRIIKMDDTFVLAYCFYRKQVRTFTIDNILSCRTVKRTEHAG